MKISFYQFDKDTHWTWYRQRVPTFWSDDMGGIVCIDDDTGKILAAVLYYNWTQNICEMAVAIDNPMVIRHKFFERAFGFPFEAYNRKSVLAHINSKNTKAINLVKKLGFTFLHSIEEGYGAGQDIMTFQLTRDNCRFINNVEELKEAS